MLFSLAFPLSVNWVIWLTVPPHGDQHSVPLRPSFQRTCCMGTVDWQPSAATPSDELYNPYQAVPAQWVCLNLAIAARGRTTLMSSMEFRDSPLAWLRPFIIALESEILPFHFSLYRYQTHVMVSMKFLPLISSFSLFIFYRYFLQSISCFLFLAWCPLLEDLSWCRLKPHGVGMRSFTWERNARCSKENTHPLQYIQLWDPV